MGKALLRVQPRTSDILLDKRVNMDSSVCKSEPHPKEEACVSDYAMCSTEQIHSFALNPSQVTNFFKWRIVQPLEKTISPYKSAIILESKIIPN